MIQATIYNEITGQIIMNMEAPDEDSVHLQIQDPQKEKILWNEKIDGNDFYFVAGAVVPRPVFTLELPEGDSLEVGEVWRVSGIPPGCVVYHPGGRTVVEDGYIEWASETPGSFKFQFELFPYKEMSLNAVVR